MADWQKFKILSIPRKWGVIRSSLKLFLYPLHGLLIHNQLKRCQCQSLCTFHNGILAVPCNGSICKLPCMYIYASFEQDMGMYCWQNLRYIADIRRADIFIRRKVVFL